MWYDLVVAALLLFCLVRGARKGFVWQLAAIAAVVLCFAFAETVSVAVAPYLNLNPPLNRWVSMLLLYIACSFVCFAAARGLKNGLEKAKFEDYDRHLGGLFGLLKGAAIAVIVTFFAVTLSEKLRPTVLTSYSGHAAAVAMHHLSPVFPEELGKVLQPYLKNFEGFEDGFGGARLANGTDDPGDLFGDGDAPAGDAPAGDGWDEDEWGGDGWDNDGRDGDRRRGGPDPIVRGSSDDPADGFGGDGFGWDADRLAGTPVGGGSFSGDGAFGDSGDFGGSPFGDPGDDARTDGAAPGQGGDWFTDGSLNRNRLREEAGGVVRDLWNDVPEDTRRSMTDSLREGVRRRAEEAVGDRLDGFLGDPNADPAAEPGPSRQELIADIAAVYNRDETVRAMIRRQSARALGPVPEDAAIDILRDWLADLRGPDAGPDPDPGTGKATTLQERIARRLTARTARPGNPDPRR